MAKKATPPVAVPKSDKMIEIEKIAAKVIAGADKLSELLNGIEPLTQGDRTAPEMAHLYYHVREMREALINACSPFASEWTASGVYDALNKKLVPEAFKRSGTTTLSMSDGYRVTIGQRYSASMLDKEKCMAWLRENDLGEIIQPYVHPSTLSAAGKALLEDKGMEFPEDLFTAFFQDTTSLTKTKAK